MLLRLALHFAIIEVWQTATEETGMTMITEKILASDGTDTIRDNRGRTWKGEKFPSVYGRRWICADLGGAVIRDEGNICSIPDSNVSLGRGEYGPLEGSFDFLANEHASAYRLTKETIGAPARAAMDFGGQEVW